MTATLSLADSSVPPSAARVNVIERFGATRRASEAIAAPLSPEDCQVQSMADASPIKWHLAHTTWFFETFVLAPHLAGYAAFNPEFRVLFNSYYNTVGNKHPRPERGLISRPTLAEVLAYRAHVDTAMQALGARLSAMPDSPALAELIVLGINHEQQHQELMLTDVKHMLSMNPLDPVYAADGAQPQGPHTDDRALAWVAFDETLTEIGHDPGGGFAFDNESPRHRVFLNRYAIANRLVSNREYLAFIEDGGYREHSLWLSDGWEWVQRERVTAPMYWRESEAGWQHFTLAGRQPLAPDAPVTHVSFYEADAYARWIGARLATEFEWEHAARHSRDLLSLDDACWQWTASAYLAYPGFRPAGGAIGEYNGKFMNQQYVLRGGSCATPRGHTRVTYRNFFQPDKRWQFTGIRLAR